jgi:hypothetical protein
LDNFTIFFGQFNIFHKNVAQHANFIKSFRATNFLFALRRKSQIREHSDLLKKLDEDLKEIKEKNPNLVDGGDRLLLAGAYALLMRHSLNEMKSGLWAILGITADDPDANRNVG